MEYELTYEQIKVLKELMYEIIDLPPSGYTTLGGYAGTGKTFLMSELSKDLKVLHKMDIAFVAPTGRAALSMKRRLDSSNVISRNDYVGTIHSFMYYPEIGEDKKVKAWIKKSRSDIKEDLVIIDEASMVGKQLWEDLTSYRFKILAVGDHGQLYPVGDEKFNLMLNPKYKLNQIHRQTENNPIIKISTDVRNNGFIPFGLYNKNVFKMSWQNPECRKIFDSITFDDETIVLCGRNNTRCDLNNKIRERLNFKLEPPYPGEKVVCLMNNKKLGIMNGEVFTVVWLTHYNKELYDMTIKRETDDILFSVLAYKKAFGLADYSTISRDVQFTQSNMYNTKKRKQDLEDYKGICLFDYGYAISVHKSQGSEWNRVVLIEERNRYQKDDEWKRWLYTGVTRSREKLFIIDGYC